MAIGGASDRTFTITNSGGDTVTGNVSESCEDFAILSGGGPFSLAHDDSVVVAVRFQPLYQGAASCTISTGTSCSVPCAGEDEHYPNIRAVRDVPGDQGGFLDVEWDAHPSDNVRDHLISRYTVWRAIDPPGNFIGSSEEYSIIERISDLPLSGDKPIFRMDLLNGRVLCWKLISSVEAYYIRAYSDVVPTLFDSTETCTGYHYVQIIAHTSDPYLFWLSLPDSGRSVDNIVPAPPGGLAARQIHNPEGLLLSWNTVTEKDLLHYLIYRNPNGVLGVTEENLIATTNDTFYIDETWHWSESYYYRVCAVDVHGNESSFSLLRPEDITGTEPPHAPATTYLRQNYPNPFNPLTRIAFGLKEPAAVSLRIYDTAGRLVRVLAEGDKAAGEYTEVWDGRDRAGRTVASGVYFYRLDAGQFSETRKMTLLR